MIEEYMFENKVLLIAGRDFIFKNHRYVLRKKHQSSEIIEEWDKISVIL
jgi:hypothetical protein